jgi:hypothetical protein
VEEGILHIELLNWPVAGDSNSEHHADGVRLHNWAKSLIVVDPRVMSETPEDPASLVAIKGPVSVKLEREDQLASDYIGATGSGDKLSGPIAHHDPILILHSCATIGVDKYNTYNGQDQRHYR